MVCVVSTALVVRFPPQAVQRFRELEKEGEFNSVSDAVRTLAERGYRDLMSERILSRIRREREAAKGLIPDDFVEDLRRYRDEEWARELKKAGGDEDKAFRAISERADRLMARWGVKVTPSA